MALIGQIRKRGWILVVMLGLGLGGFLIMDMSGGGGPAGQQQLTVGEVNGERIDWIQFQRAQEALYSNSTLDVYSQRDFLWDYFVEEKLIEEESDKNGLFVGDDEMEELQFGANISPVVRRNFADPTTGQLDVATLNQFREASRTGQLAPQFQAVWNFQQDEVKKDRLQTKLTSLVTKGMYTPTWMAEELRTQSGSTVDFEYVLVPFDQVNDSEVEVTDADYTAYIKEQGDLYQQDEETRDAEFVVFDVFPTPEDTVLILERFNELITQFETAAEDSIFALNNYGTYEVPYIKQNALSPAIADTAFDLAVGSVYGPFIENGNFVAAKVIGRRVVPDSVRARHILLNATSQDQLAAMFQLADTIEAQIADGRFTFDSLARQYSLDQTSAINGGDLGYVAEGAFVKPMNDLLFHTEMETGNIYRAASQFGLHLVEMLGTKNITNEEGVRLAYITEAIIPSQMTQDALYDDILEFAGLNRTIDQLEESVAARDDVTMETALAVGRNAYDFGQLGPGTNSRGIVQWMFDRDTEKSEVAPEVFIFEDAVNYFNSKYVVVGLTEINKPGLAQPAQVMDEIQAEVINRKKADVLKSQVQSKDLDAIASQFDVPVDTASQVIFSTQFLEGIGSEPNILGAAFGMPLNEVSEPIVGRNGVYVIKVTGSFGGATSENMSWFRQQGSIPYQSAASFQFIETLKDNADIEDMRSTFY